MASVHRKGTLSIACIDLIAISNFSKAFMDINQQMLVTLVLSGLVNVLLTCMISEN